MDRNNFLNIDENMEQLMKMLKTEWNRNHYASQLQNRSRIDLQGDHTHADITGGQY